VLWIRIRCLSDPWIQNTGWAKKSRFGSGMNIPDHNSESLETNFWAQKYFDSFMQIRIRNLFDSGSGIKTFGDKAPGSTTLPVIVKKNENNSLDTVISPNFVMGT
jgi:hypothetical protein